MSWWRAACLTALVMGLAACGTPTDPQSEGTSPPATPATIAIWGRLQVQFDRAALMQNPDRKEGGPCISDSGYDDIRDGGDVVVTDPSGKTIGLGKLEPGEVEQDSSGDLLGWCSHFFRVADVPAGFNFYGIKVGHRDAKQFTSKEVSSQIILQLGKPQNA